MGILNFFNKFSAKEPRVKTKMNVTTFQNYEFQRQEQVKEVQRLSQNAIPSPNGLTPTEILMIHYAPTYNTNQEKFQSFWLYRYAADNPKSILEKLLNEGFIAIASYYDTLSNLTVNELKAILKKLGLNQDKKKSDLISAIKQNATEEFLKSQIPFLTYKITDLGEKELKQNEYVLYFHNNVNAYGMNVWDINQQLKNYPLHLWRDKIWAKLNEDCLNTFEDTANSNFKRYVQIKFTMCNFLTEEKRELKTALSCWTEAAFYDVNFVSSEEYSLRLRVYEASRKFNKDFKSEKPQIDDCYIFTQNIKSLITIKNCLNMSDNELYDYLEKEFKNKSYEKSSKNAKEAIQIIKNIVSMENLKS